MKSIGLFLFLFIIESSISEISLDKFSINSFLQKLKTEGLYEPIRLIKDFYGENSSIIACQELNKNHNGFCKKVVTDYMPNNTYLNKLKKMRVKYLIKSINNVLEPVYVRQEEKPVSIEKLLKKVLPPEKAEEISKRIIERAKNECGILIKN